MAFFKKKFLYLHKAKREEQKSQLDQKGHDKNSQRNTYQLNDLLVIQKRSMINPGMSRFRVRVISSLFTDAEI